MWRYIIFVGVWAVIIFGWIVPHWLIIAIKKRIISGIYEACGMTVFFTLVILGWLWMKQDIKLLAYIGLALYIPAAYFVVSSFINLKHKGKPESGWEETTLLIDTGVYGITRHPMYFGTALWMLGIVLIQQSIISIILGIIGIFCCFMASKKEDLRLIEKFGDAYKEYMKKVPMWNFLKSLFKSKR